MQIIHRVCSRTRNRSRWSDARRGHDTSTVSSIKTQSRPLETSLWLWLSLKLKRDTNTEEEQNKVYFQSDLELFYLDWLNRIMISVCEFFIHEDQNSLSWHREKCWVKYLNKWIKMSLSWLQFWVEKLNYVALVYKKPKNVICILH